jgi:hypothetical protein
MTYRVRCESNNWLVIFSIQQIANNISEKYTDIYIIILLKKHVGCNTIFPLKQRNLSKC